jgi:hypothetical protein
MGLWEISDCPKFRFLLLYGLVDGKLDRDFFSKGE